MEEATNTSKGKTLFVQQCGSCHTLADAGTRGVIGPNLDDAFHSVRVDQGFDESTIRDVVRGDTPIRPSTRRRVGRGCRRISSPATMRMRSASYVASVAGLPVMEQPGGDGGGQGSTDGETIFTQQLRQLPHARRGGDDGDDRPEPRRLEADERARGRTGHERGWARMPAFEGTLSPEQIDAVADYVSMSAGGR